MLQCVFINNMYGMREMLQCIMMNMRSQKTNINIYIDKENNKSIKERQPLAVL